MEFVVYFADANTQKIVRTEKIDLPDIDVAADWGVETAEASEFVVRVEQTLTGERVPQHGALVNGSDMVCLVTELVREGVSFIADKPDDGHQWLVRFGMEHYDLVREVMLEEGIEV